MKIGGAKQSGAATKKLVAALTFGFFLGVLSTNLTSLVSGAHLPKDTETLFVQQDRKNGQISVLRQFDIGEYRHRVHYMIDLATRICLIEQYEVDGVPHRSGAPATVYRNRVTGQLAKTEWQEHGKTYTPSDDELHKWLMFNRQQPTCNPLDPKM